MNQKPFSHVHLWDLLYLPSDEFTEDLYHELRDRVSIRDPFDPSHVSEYVFDKRAGYYGVPKFALGPIENLTDNIIDKRTETPVEPFGFTSTLLDGQREVVARLEKDKAKGITSWVIQADPGWGKTVAAIAIAQLLGQLTVVVVPKSDLVDQWVSRILEHTDLKKSEVAVAANGKTNFHPKKHKILVGLVHTLALKRFEQYADVAGTVIFDEVHVSVPPTTFAPVAFMYTAKYTIGVSATMERRDNRHKVFEWQLQQSKLVGKANKNTMKATVYAVHYPNSSGPVPQYIPMSDKIKYRSAILALIARNKERLTLIAKMALQAVRTGRRVCLISDRTGPLHELNMMLKGSGYITGFFCSSLSDLDGRKLRTSIPKKEQEETKKNADIILATYGLMSYGTDIKDLGVIILVTPQSQAQQTKGRVERYMEGKKSPIIIDVIDTYYAQARKWYEGREKDYNKSDLPIKKYSHEQF